jgi:hypothetical protein
MKHTQIDVCSKCHPFYTGQLKYVDSKGHVNRFKKKIEIGKKNKEILQKKKQVILEQKRKQKEPPKTLREMLLGK